jgi:uncharacterized lipoprotein YbaY
LVTFTLILTACGSNNAQDITFRGEIVLANNGKLPQHAIAHVSLIQQGADSNEKGIVAERSLHDLGTKPIHFTLTVRRGLIKNNGHYGLSAQILGAQGHIRWATPLPVEIKPRKPPSTITLMLQEVKAQATFERYNCRDGFQFAAKIDGRQAILQLGNRQVVLYLRHLVNGIPEAYVDSHGNRLEFTAATTTLRLDGQTHNHCQRLGRVNH